MKTKRHFPGEYGYKDIIKFKRKGKIVEGMIVSCIDTDAQYVEYQVHSLVGAEERFYFYSVKDNKIIRD